MMGTRAASARAEAEGAVSALCSRTLWVAGEQFSGRGTVYSLLDVCSIVPGFGLRRVKESRYTGLGLAARRRK